MVLDFIANIWFKLLKVESLFIISSAPLLQKFHLLVPPDGFVNTSFEILSGGAPLLSDSERTLTYYNLNVGYNILPGEGFIGEGHAYNTALYISAGLGSTRFAGDDRFTVNFGVGYRFLLNDSIALHVDFRDHLFDIDLLGEEKTAHNLEGTLGLTWFF